MVDMERQKYGITEDMIQAAKALFDARAHEEIVKPQVLTYQRLILAKHCFYVSEEFKDEPCASLPISDPEKSWLMSDENHAVYVSECLRERDRLGLATKLPDGCPLLEARSRRTEAEWKLFDAFSRHPRFGHLKGANQSAWHLREQALDLALKFMKPFVDGQSSVAQL